MSTYTRLHAAQMLATALGAVEKEVPYWLAGWSSKEIACGVGCRAPANNLWASGEKMPGSTCWNCPGHRVQNYPNLSIGIGAMVINLQDGRYKRLLAALQSGNIAALSNSLGVQADLRTWCGSTCYSGETASFIAAGKAHANDLFEEFAGGSASGSSQIKSCQDICNQYLAVDTSIGSGDTEQSVQQHITACMAACADCEKHKDTEADCKQALDQYVQKQVSDANQGILPGWLVNPDWNRVLKFILGLVVTGFGLLLIYQVLSGNSVLKNVKSAALLAA